MLDMASWTCLIFFLVSPICSNAGILNQELSGAGSKLSAIKDVLTYNERTKYMEDYGKSWVVLGDGNGKPQFGLIRPQKELRSTALHEVMFMYFSKDYPRGVLLNSGDIMIIDPEKPVKIIIHGWMSDINHESVTLIKKAYMTYADFNVILCDWSEMAYDVIYSRAAHTTSVLGVVVGVFVDRLVLTTGIDYSNIHLIGHSLGSHIASAAGKFVQSKIGRITNLDPASPCFEMGQSCSISNPLSLISNTDAEFVDAIHTCVGVAGLKEPVGHVDFYPNGGSPVQPGCSSEDYPLAEQVCSHARSYQYYAESIKNDNFKAIKCASWAQFLVNECEDSYTFMGESTPETIRGFYFLKTNEISPFAMGDEGVVN